MNIWQKIRARKPTILSTDDVNRKIFRKCLPGADEQFIEEMVVILRDYRNAYYETW